MKKILLAIMLTFGMASATEFIVPDLCNDLGIGCPGPVGPEGPQGPQGEKGDTGETGPAGEQGVAGNDGATGETGAQGQAGEQGIAGTNGVDGQDGMDFNSKEYQDSHAEFLSYGKKATDYYEDLAAGSAAMAAIDFGTTEKGVWELGLGIGHSGSFDGSSTVGAVGAKYSFTDTEAVIVKSWYSGDDSYAVGGAVTTRF